MNTWNKWSPTTHLQWLTFQNLGLFQWFLKWIYALTKNIKNSNWKHLCTDCVNLSISPMILPLNITISVLSTRHKKGKGIHWSCKFLPGVNYFSYGGKKKEKNKKRCGSFFSLFCLLGTTLQVAFYVLDRTYSLTPRAW